MNQMTNLSADQKQQLQEPGRGQVLGISIGTILKRMLRTIFVSVGYLVVLWLLWEGIIYLFKIEPYLLPTPRSVIKSFASLPNYYWVHTKVTFQEAGLGALIGALAGFLLGILLRYGGLAARLLNPVILATQVFPKEALAPIFLVFLGFGLLPKIVISALICFFPVAVNTAKGLEATPTGFNRLMHVLGASRWQMFWYCHLPFAIPYIFAALRVCTSLSVIGAVVGEFVGSSAGLGHVIRVANSDIGTERVYASLLLLGAMGGLFFGSAVFIEKVVFRRYTAVT
jgi:NitT/TauT family transport system permease protein